MNGRDEVSVSLRAGQGVVMKERKMNGPGKKFFDAEAALNRRLKNSAGVASFIGEGEGGEEGRNRGSCG